MDRPWLARARRVGPRPYERFIPSLAELADAAGPAVPDPPDPEVFIQAACYHGVAGHIFTALRTERLRLPSESIRALEAVHAETMVRAALLRHELKRVGPTIALACGTAPILIKGPALADRFHETPELRPFVDLDFVVPPSALAAAVDALSGENAYTVISQRWPASLERHGHAVELCRTVGTHSLGLELHWRISDDPLAASLDHARLAAGGVAVLRDAPEVVVPGYSEQLLVVALHILHHSERRLIWLLDLVAVARATSDAQWREAFDLAEEIGVAWVLHAALDICEWHLRFDRPRPIPRTGLGGWGPLRTAQTIRGPVGYHVGHLATLSWLGRLDYLATGTRGRLARASEALRLGRSSSRS